MTLDVPADPRSGRVLRSVARSAGSHADFGYDRIEDLGLAIDEAFAFLLEWTPLAVRCSLVQDGDSVEVTMTTDDEGGTTPTSSWDTSLHRVILESVATDVAQQGRRVAFRIRA